MGNHDIVYFLATIAYHGGIQAIMCFVVIGQVLKILWYFEILTWASKGKSLNVQCLKNGWLYTEMDENLELGVPGIAYVEYFHVQFF